MREGWRGREGGDRNRFIGRHVGKSVENGEKSHSAEESIVKGVKMAILQKGRYWKTKWLKCTQCKAGCSTDDATPRSNWSAVPVGVTGGPVQQIMY